MKHLSLPKQSILSTPQNRKGLLISFLIFFLFSILFANFKCEDQIFWLGFQIENSLKQVETSGLSWVSFVAFFFQYRFLLWLIPVLLNFSHRGRQLLPLFFGWLGFSLGFFLTTVIHQFQLLSFPLILMLLFPQAFFYGIAYMTLIRDQKQPDTTNIFQILLYSGLFAFGTICEFWISPHLIQMANHLLSFFNLP